MPTMAKEKNNTTDALEDTLKHNEFKPKGSGLPKPSDIIAAEEAQNKRNAGGEEELEDGGAVPLPERDENGNIIPPETEEEEGAGEGEGEKGADGEKDETEGGEETPEVKAAKEEVQKLEALQKKLDNKEELNEEETALYIKVKNLPPEQKPEEKTYNIAGTEYSYDELKEKVVEELELQDAVISEKAMKKVVEDYYKSQNRTEATRAINRGQKENAQERETLRAERAQILATQRMIAETLHDLSADITKLEKAANDPVTKEEAEDGDLDVKNRYFKKLEAQEKLSDIHKKREDLEARGVKNESLKINNEVAELQMAQPQYQTKEPILTVIQKLKKGEPVDPEDEIKVQEISDLLETASTRGSTLIQMFNLRSKQGTLAVKPLLHKKSASVSQIIPELSNKTSITDAIRRAKERANLSLPGSEGSGGGGQRGTVRKETQAAAIIRHDKKILGEEVDEFARDVLGFGVQKKK